MRVVHWKLAVALQNDSCCMRKVTSVRFFNRASAAMLRTFFHFLRISIHFRLTGASATCSARRRRQSAACCPFPPCPIDTPPLPPVLLTPADRTGRGVQQQVGGAVATWRLSPYRTLPQSRTSRAVAAPAIGHTFGPGGASAMLLEIVTPPSPGQWIRKYHGQRKDERERHKPQRVELGGESLQDALVCVHHVGDLATGVRGFGAARELRKLPVQQPQHCGAYSDLLLVLLPALVLATEEVDNCRQKERQSQHVPCGN